MVRLGDFCPRVLIASRAQVVAFFSATLPEAAEELARSLLAAPVRVTVGERGGAAPSVAQRLVYVGSEAGRRLALREMLAAGLAPPVLVFVASQQRAAALHECAPSTHFVSWERRIVCRVGFRVKHAAALHECTPTCNVSCQRRMTCTRAGVRV